MFTCGARALVPGYRHQCNGVAFRHGVPKISKSTRPGEFWRGQLELKICVHIRTQQLIVLEHSARAASVNTAK